MAAKRAWLAAQPSTSTERPSSGFWRGRALIGLATSFFAANSHGTDFDPEIEILAKRVMAIRRLATGSEEARRRVEDILAVYRAAGRRGTVVDEDALDQLMPAPPPLHKDRGKWDPDTPPKGPVALLAHSLHLVGAAVGGQPRDI